MGPAAAVTRFAVTPASRMKIGFRFYSVIQYFKAYLLLAHQSIPSCKQQQCMWNIFPNFRFQGRSYPTVFAYWYSTTKIFLFFSHKNKSTRIKRKFLNVSCLKFDFRIYRPINTFLSTLYINVHVTFKPKIYEKLLGLTLSNFYCQEVKKQIFNYVC